MAVTVSDHLYTPTPPPRGRHLVAMSPTRKRRDDQVMAVDLLRESLRHHRTGADGSFLSGFLSRWFCSWHTWWKDPWARINAICIRICASRGARHFLHLHTRTASNLCRSTPFSFTRSFIRIWDLDQTGNEHRLICLFN